MTVHAIRCKKTNEAIAVKLDGGYCVCPSIYDCALHPVCGMCGESLEKGDHNGCARAYSEIVGGGSYP